MESEEFDVEGQTVQLVYKGESWNNGRVVCKAKGKDLMILDTQAKIDGINDMRKQLGKYFDRLVIIYPYVTYI